MEKKKYQYIYGPVSSWRLGISLGIDPLSSEEKTCNFNCKYCQLGPTLHFVCRRDVFVPTEYIVEEIQSLPQDVHIDYMTFSGRGEPTLAKNLGDIILAIKSVRSEKIAVITNSVLMNRADVQEDLLHADFILAKLDAFDQESLQAVNEPASGVRYEDIIRGIKDFRNKFDKKFALQIMFTEKNKASASHIAQQIRDIKADEVELNTPLRPSPATPLTPEDLMDMKKLFLNHSVTTVYELQQKEVAPMNKQDTIRRHGLYDTNSFED